MLIRNAPLYPITQDTPNMRNPITPASSTPFPISSVNFGTPPTIIPHLPPGPVPQMPPIMLDKSQLDFPINGRTLRQRVRKLFGG